MSRKLRVLLLHGHAQTAEEMVKKSGGLRKELKPLAEFVTYESPMKMDGDLVTWYDYRPVDGVTRYRGLEESLLRLGDFMEREGPFDGVMGFSMGAAITAFLCDRVVKGELPAVAAFHFAVLISAPSSRDETAQIAKQIDLPSCHIWGTTDNIIPSERSKELSDCFVNPTNIVHEGGHHMPTIAPARKGLKAFFAAQHAAMVERDSKL